MTGAFSLKLKTNRGQFILNGLTADITIGEFKARIATLTKIPISNMHILIGFPPQAIDLSDNNKTIGANSIKGGETIIIEEKYSNNITPGKVSNTPGTSHDVAIKTTTPQATLDADEALARGLQDGDESTLSLLERVLLKRVVPADNSCLFSSIRFALYGELNEHEGSELMRHIIAEEVSANPDIYNDAILGKSNADYCAWIQKPDSWGGAIEVAILSNHYDIEIDVIDAQNAIINRFGEDKNYKNRVFLLFDGIHYDPLYVESVESDKPVTVFSVNDHNLYRNAQQLAVEAKAARQYTNVDKFTLSCQECGAMLVGQLQAQAHAKATGHKRFGEI